MMWTLRAVIADAISKASLISTAKNGIFPVSVQLEKQELVIQVYRFLQRLLLSAGTSRRTSSTKREGLFQ